ncbi:MAG: response regulator [Gammaproteobacteria bacterium]|nr:response regulator [Gammaproteobacteria bacterium]
MHPQIISQLREAGLTPDSPLKDPAKWQKFLSLVERSYVDAERRRPGTPSFRAPNERVVEELDKLKAVIASFNDGLCVFDRNAVLLFVNPAAEFYLGIKSVKLDCTSLLAHFKLRDQWQSESYLEISEILQMIKEGGSLYDSDASILQADGRALAISCTINPISDNERVTGAVLVFHDISIHKQLDADLIAAKESAEKSSLAKSDFLSSMSHELRTPMNAILGYGEILQEDLGDPPDGCEEDYLGDLQSYTDHILQAGRQLLGLINNVLDLTRIESGNFDIKINKIDLLEVVKASVQETAGLFKNKGISLDDRSVALKSIRIIADADRLRQVITQLLSNAVKYNNENGSVIIMIEQNVTERVRLLIKDTGIGMTPEQQALIFKPFTRVSGRNLSEGTGVGLTITKELLEIMDGHIGIDSQLDKGSTFWIELPTGLTREEADKEKEIPPADRKYVLLYVEDSRTNVSLVAKILRARPDVALISAPTGELGLELARAHRPNVILLDINLPGIDGFEVLTRLRAYKETRGIPVMGLSADDSVEALDQARAAGFFSYIIKPLKKSEFLETINSVLVNLEKK